MPLGLVVKEYAPYWFTLPITSAATSPTISKIFLQSIKQALLWS
jgi:hypothetical protein